MHSFVRTRPTARPTSDGKSVIEHRGDAHVASSSAASVSAGAEPLNHSPQAQSLLQMRQVLDEGPGVRSQLALQRALNQPGTSLAAAPPGSKRKKPAPMQKKVNATDLLDRLKAGVESLSGLAMDDVRVHYNSAKPATMQAHAYAQGPNIHMAPGQEKHLPHEAWHVVQQKQGRVKPMLQMKGVAINDDAGLEQEADVIGARALRSIEGHEGDFDMSPETSGPVTQLTNAGGVNNEAKQDSALSKSGSKIVQFGKWTKTKANRYKKHLTRRGKNRALKHKPVHKLVRKYVNARKLADPTFKGLSLADAPQAGHHVPALAMANKRLGTMPFGQRGSAKEKARRRVYFSGSKKQRENAHGIAHMAETMAGLGSRTEAKYSGTDEQLAETQRLAHRDLTLDDGQTPISVELQSQAHREDKITPANTMLIHEATDYIFQHDHNIPEDKSINYLPETTDSEPESDEEKWMSDSDADNNNNTYQQTNNNNSGRHVARLSNNNVNNINYSGNTTSGRPATNRNYQSRRSSNNPTKKNNTNRNKHDDDSDKKGN